MRAHGFLMKYKMTRKDLSDNPREFMCATLKLV